MTEDNRKNLLKDLLMTQRFAVLATLSDRQPYTSLIAFAVSEDLRYIIFATERSTGKFSNMQSNSGAALLVDNRSNSQSDLTGATAVTALGTAGETGAERHKQMKSIFLRKHPSLADFLEKSGTALITVKVTDYIVAGFSGAERIRVADL